jgi:hypothetical protein
MSHRSLAALILLNSVLLAALVVTSFSPNKAHAQGLRSGSQFMMIAGSVTGRDDLSGIYIIDRQTTRMIAATYDSRNDRFDIISRGRVISQDVERNSSR